MKTEPLKHPRQANYQQRQKSKGLVLTAVWVPPEGRKAIQSLAAKLRKGEATC